MAYHTKKNSNYEQRQKINILIFSGCYLPGYKGGGPIKTIKNLIEQTSDSISYKVVTLDRDLGDKTSYSNIQPNRWNQVGSSQVFYIEPGLKGFKQIFNILHQESYDVIYLNSFFSPKFSFFPLLLSKLLKQKVVLGPRGEFSEGALKIKSDKKNTFIKAYKFLGLPKDVVFQASSSYEAEDIKRVLGPAADSVIAEDIGSQEFAMNIPKRGDTIKAVFISRISPKKNLSLALEILRDVQVPLIYDIYGPIEDAKYWQECKNIIANLPPNISIEYKGELKPEQVVERLSSYDFFFMPTKGENYGHVIAEALCAGLPLVISDQTPWRNLKALGIGWDLPLNNSEAFSTVIENLSKMPVDEHMKMRETILTWAKHKFAQRDAIEANIAMFHYAHNKNKE